MIAEQLVTFAKDFIEEYKSFKILELLTSVSVIMQRREASQQTYPQETTPLRKTCQEIITNTRFRSYPQGWQRAIAESGFAQFLPAEVAKTILSALPINPQFAPLSSEINLYQSHCNNAFVQANALLPFTHQFSLSALTIPKGELGVIVDLPRIVFNNETKGFAHRWRVSPI